MTIRQKKLSCSCCQRISQPTAAAQLVKEKAGENEGQLMIRSDAHYMHQSTHITRYAEYECGHNENCW